MRIDLTGRVFVVTGAAQGIGAAIVGHLAEAGATVAAVDIDGPGMATLGTASRHEADLGDRAAVHGVMDEIAGRHGRIEGLVTAAGGVRGQVGRPLEEIAPDDWQAIFAANVDAAMWCAQAAAPHLKAAGGVRIVTISSGAGLCPQLDRHPGLCLSQARLSRPDETACAGAWAAWNRPTISPMP